MLVRSFLITIFCMLYVSTLLAETYIREYTYNASEADSKITSRIIALDQIKILLLQEIGTYLHQEINITKDGHGNSFAREEVEAVTAGLTNVTVLEENWDGVTFYLKAKVDADTERVISAIEDYKKANSKEKQQLEVLKENEREISKSRREIERLKQQLKEANSDAKKQEVIVSYNEQVGRISASEMFNRGYDSSTTGDYTSAFYWFKKAAEKGSASAQHNLGTMYSEGMGVQKDDVMAAYWMQKAAKQSVAYSQFVLGIFYQLGWGVTQDDKKAFFWHEKAAMQGIVKSQSFLGGSYLEGIGVEQDNTKALYWTKKAAEKNDVTAQTMLGLMYERESDSEKAIYWHQKAAKQGQAVSQYYLAEVYEKISDSEKAIYWYQKAAKQGHADAQHMLGLRYFLGSGVSKNAVIAKDFLKTACSGGNKRSCEIYTTLVEKGL